MTDPQQVIDLLRYEDANSAFSYTHDIVLDDDGRMRFMKHLERYLRGEGHPMHPDWGLEHIDQESRECVAHDKVMRSQRLLALTTGTELLPSNPKLHIRVCFISLHFWKWARLTSPLLGAIHSPASR